MNVVVVESPAKAKTINKYLGSDFQVLASYGHVRDLPPRDGSVRPEQDFAMDWEVEERSDKRIKAIAKAVKGADRLFLATDPDREGEAISWHIAEELQNRDVLTGVKVERVVFNEVTKTAVVEAFKHPRDLNKELIEAYLARRALDYLVGFTLSPVLWRKLPGSRSAGRVQSVALRLICEREAEIEVFKPREYWSIFVDLTTVEGQTLRTRLTYLDGKKLEKFDIASELKAREIAERLAKAQAFRVENVEKKETKRHPFPPFTTSTLQQEASRKLNLGASRTMRIAQKLYEGVDLDGETVGLITYMRTDGVQLSNEAIAAARRLIDAEFGDRHLPDGPRLYKSKQKNAQEAHEAIRPTDLFRKPAAIKSRLSPEEYALYELIWKRTLASQMASAELDQVAIDIAVDGEVARLRASGSVVTFEGFLALYQEDRDDKSEEDESEEGRRLPKLSTGEALTRRKVEETQHFTQPPPRYTEASLVKRLEELGIGRPSTYASIIQVLQDRDYVRLEKRRFQPEDRGRLVTAFLTSFFERYVEYTFTAELEEQLDDISGGRIDWKRVLKEFWEVFKTSVDEAKELRITDVVDALDAELGPHFFPHNPDKPDVDPRTCPTCGGRLGLRVGRTGGFIGCSNYPECRYTRPLAVPGGDAQQGSELSLPKTLGHDPQTGEPVSLRKGPFGFYVQLGENGDNGKPKRASLPRNLKPDELTLEQALALLALPREVGQHPESGETITAGIGRYGPYIKHQNSFVSLKEDDDVLSIGLNRAVTLISEAPKRASSQTGKEIGQHPDDGKPVYLYKGRYGPYVKHGRTIASLPKGEDVEKLTLERSLELLASKKAKGKSPSKSKTSSKTKRRSKSGAKGGRNATETSA